MKKIKKVCLPQERVEQLMHRFNHYIETTENHAKYMRTVLKEIKEEY